MPKYLCDGCEQIVRSENLGKTWKVRPGWPAVLALCVPCSGDPAKVAAQDERFEREFGKNAPT